MTAITSLIVVRPLLDLCPETFEEVAMTEPTIDSDAVRDTPRRTTLSGRRFGRISMSVEPDAARERERISVVQVLASAVDDRWETISRRVTDARHRPDLRDE